MKVCRVKVEPEVCKSCEDFERCEKCRKCHRELYGYYELLSVGVDPAGRGYAMVLYDGVISKVALERVYNVHDA